jgi:hypothetical protein
MGLQELYSDCETALAEGEWLKSKLKARGIELKIRAPGQHARYIERRGALLRETMHLVEAQLERECVKCDMSVLLAEAVCAGNCLTFVAGVTPYHLVDGRQPAFPDPQRIQI